MRTHTVFTVMIKPEIQKKVREKARREERTISAVVERMLRAGLDADDTQLSQQETTANNGKS